MCSVAGLDGDRVKSALVGDFKAQLFQAAHKKSGVAGNALGNALEALRAVVDRVHAGHDGRQHLRGADVGGGFFAADVLFARLQREAVGWVAVSVHTGSHQPAGQRALEFVATRQVGSVRPAIAHGHAKALGAAQHDVGVPLTWRHQERERQQVGGHAQGGAVGVCLAGQRPQVVDGAGGGRVLRQHAEVVARCHQLRHGA